MTGTIGLPAFFAASPFAGAAVSAGVAGHPARMRLDEEAVLDRWRPRHARGKATDDCCRPAAAT